MEIFNSLTVESEEQFAAIAEVRSNFGSEPPSRTAFPLNRQDNCDRQPSKARHRDGLPPAVVSSEAALLELQEDVVNLEKTIVQRKQLKQEAYKQQVKERIQHLEEQAERINALAEQLAAEMVKFQEMAQQADRDCRAISSPENPGISLPVAKQDSTRPASLWEVRDFAVPTVVKRGFQFILTAIKVEKPGSEEENAAQRTAIAQQRREALERWLEGRRKRIFDNFSGL